MSKIIRAAKISTNIIQEGQPDVYGFTISTHGSSGEFTATSHKNIDTDSLTVSEKKTVDDFITLISLKLANNGGL